MPGKEEQKRKEKKREGKKIPYVKKIARSLIAFHFLVLWDVLQKEILRFILLGRKRVWETDGVFII